MVGVKTAIIIEKVVAAAAIAASKRVVDTVMVFPLLVFRMSHPSDNQLLAEPVPV